MAMKCKLGDLQDDLTKTMVICGLNDQYVKKVLLQEEDSLSLDKVVERCIILEASEEHSEHMSGNTRTVDTVNSLQSFKSRKEASQSPQHKSGFIKKISGCSRCGGSHLVNKCPAYGKECNFCHVPNHFESKCMKKKNMKVNEIIQEVHTKGRCSNMYVAEQTS
uniref:Uncharacterized protein LOC114330932 n=1 Tax=Diabrotica virgifera virgifera TaxID=50390 RepID=A0A6P7FJN4_DIAVI